MSRFGDEIDDDTRPAPGGGEHAWGHPVEEAEDRTVLAPLGGEVDDRTAFAPLGEGADDHTAFAPFGDDHTVVTSSGEDDTVVAPLGEDRTVVTSSTASPGAQAPALPSLRGGRVAYVPDADAVQRYRVRRTTPSPEPRRVDLAPPPQRAQSAATPARSPRASRRRWLIFVASALLGAVFVMTVAIVLLMRLWGAGS